MGRFPIGVGNDGQLFETASLATTKKHQCPASLRARVSRQLIPFSFLSEAEESTHAKTQTRRIGQRKEHQVRKAQLDTAFDKLIAEGKSKAKEPCDGCITSLSKLQKGIPKTLTNWLDRFCLSRIRLPKQVESSSKAGLFHFIQPWSLTKAFSEQTGEYTDFGPGVNRQHIPFSFLSEAEESVHTNLKFGRFLA